MEEKEIYEKFGIKNYTSKMIEAYKNFKETLKEDINEEFKYILINDTRRMPEIIKRVFGKDVGGSWTEYGGDKIMVIGKRFDLYTYDERGKDNMVFSFSLLDVLPTEWKVKMYKKIIC